MKDVAKEINLALENYVEEFSEEAERDFDLMAEETLEKLKSIAPVKTGKYKKSLKIKKEQENRLQSKRTIYASNKQHIKAHLLENGHIIKNQYGQYGRVRNIPHWKLAEEFLIGLIEKYFNSKK